MILRYLAALSFISVDAKTRTIHGGGQKIKVGFENMAKEPMKFYWVDYDGKEIYLDTINAHKTTSQDTHRGHVFVARSASNGDLWATRQILEEDDGRTVKIRSPLVSDKTRWAEFESLVAYPKPCSEEAGLTSTWSCIRYITNEEAGERDSSLYGFSQSDTIGYQHATVGATDVHNTKMLPFIRNITSYEKGYLLMNMSKRLKAVLLSWFEKERVKNATRVEEWNPEYPVQNSRSVETHIHDLNDDPPVYDIVMEEMQQILQWWAGGIQLRHTATYGVRTYHRNSTLLNHFDREWTHIASAILQIRQNIDEDGGWPVTVIHPNEHGFKEVFLQPGQMLLYEGARMKHGRPMRLKGDDYSNMFVHFCPLDWHGPDIEEPNPYFVGKPLKTTVCQ